MGVVENTMYGIVEVNAFAESTDHRQTEWRAALPRSGDHSSRRPYFLIVTADIKWCCRGAIMPAARGCYPYEKAPSFPGDLLK